MKYHQLLAQIAKFLSLNLFHFTQTSRTHMSSEHGLIDEEKLVSSDATLAFNIKQDYHSGECVLCDKTFEGMTNEEVSRFSYVQHGRDLVFRGNFSQLVVLGGK